MKSMCCGDHFSNKNIYKKIYIQTCICVLVYNCIFLLRTHAAFSLVKQRSFTTVYPMNCQNKRFGKLGSVHKIHMGLEAKSWIFQVFRESVHGGENGSGQWILSQVSISLRVPRIFLIKTTIFYIEQYHARIIQYEVQSLSPKTRFQSLQIAALC